MDKSVFGFVSAFLVDSGYNLEWKTQEGRTFEVSGDPRFPEMYYEVFDSAKKVIRKQEADFAFEAASGDFFLFLFSGEEKKGESLSREQFLDQVQNRFPAFVRIR